MIAAAIITMLEILTIVTIMVKDYDHDDDCSHENISTHMYLYQGRAEGMKFGSHFLLWEGTVTSRHGPGLPN